MLEKIILELLRRIEVNILLIFVLTLIVLVENQVHAKFTKTGDENFELWYFKRFGLNSGLSHRCDDLSKLLVDYLDRLVGCFEELKGFSIFKQLRFKALENENGQLFECWTRDF